VLPNKQLLLPFGLAKEYNMTEKRLKDNDLDVLFRAARTANGFTAQPVADDLLLQVYDLMKYGATGANSCPLRIVFVKTDEAKARLKPLLDDGNVERTISAPVTAIFAYDRQFYDHLPFLFPHCPDARSWFTGDLDQAVETAKLNGTLQAAYFMLAARSLGLDCGPMGGFNAAGVDAAFFPDGRFGVLFLCNLGYADHTKTFPRSPRFTFEQVCQLV
jgi:3-hydroxypropanoate dehydrogenase